MKYSILVPVYNVEDYLSGCLDSILNQTCKDFEIILVDDGSSDNSGIICDKYKNKYPECITVIHQDNQGLISARRVAIAIAKGEFCVFVDSDDFIEYNLLETVNQCLKANEDVDIVMYTYYYYSNGKKTEREKIAENGTVWDNRNKEDIYQKLAFSCAIDAIWIKAIKTDLLRKDPIQYIDYKNKNMSEDLLQSLYPITFAKKIIYLDEPLYNYRYNDQSISRCFDKSTLSRKNSLHVYNEIKNIIPFWHVNEKEYITRINARWFNETMYIFFNSYENACTESEKNEILRFDWSSMLPSIADNSFYKYTNKNYIKVYNWWKSQKFLIIKMFFKKISYYRKYKQLKKCIRK